MRRWMILVAVVVVAIAGFAVFRLNGIFGSKDVVSTPDNSANDTSRSTPSTCSSRSSVPRARPRPSTSSTQRPAPARRQRVAAVVARHHHDPTGGLRQRLRHRVTATPSPAASPSTTSSRTRDRSTRERIHLLPGQVRMSHHVAESRPTPDVHRPRRPLDPLALRADRAVLDRRRRAEQRVRPQLEAVGEEHYVALSSPTRRRCRRSSTSARSSRSSTPTARRWSCSKATSRSAPTRTSTTTTWSSSFNEDTTHVEHVQDFWGDPLTAAARRARTARPRYVQVYLPATRARRCPTSPSTPPQHRRGHAGAAGVKAYVTGAAPQITDNFEVGNEGTALVTALTFGVIAVMLLIVYRSLRHHAHRARHGARRDGGRPRHRRVPGARGLHRPVDVRDESPDAAGHRRGHRLRHLPGRPLSGGRNEGWTARARTTTCSAGRRTSSSARG